MYEKALPSVCTHLCFFKRARFFTRKKVALFIALSSSFTTFFFTFQKEERERERLIFVERTTLIIIKAHDARAHKQKQRNGEYIKCSVPHSSRGIDNTRSRRTQR